MKEDVTIMLGGSLVGLNPTQVLVMAQDGI